MVKIIKNIILTVGLEKFVTIISDNRSNIAAACRMICKEYPNILNVRCIAHYINLISFNIVKVNWIKSLIKYMNSITKYFKNSHLASVWLKKAIQLKGIEGEGLKTYVEIHWTTVYECVLSVWRLKDVLQNVWIFLNYKFFFNLNWLIYLIYVIIVIYINIINKIK